MELNVDGRFERFIASMVAEGRYKDEQAVISAALSLLEQDEEYRLQALRAAIQEGLESGIAEGWNSADFLARKHAEWNAKGVFQ